MENVEIIGIPDEVMETVPEIGEPIKEAGPFAFRLDSYDVVEKDGEPTFLLRWVCQQEPYVGRVVLDSCPWLSAETAKILQDKNHLLYEEAVQKARKRLWRAKSLFKALGAGSASPIEVFDTHPEVKLQLKVVERKQRMEDGSLRPTGELVNQVVQYFSLIPF